MSFALLPYTGLTGAAASNFDLTAVPDPEFSIRNGHFIFSESYRMAGAIALGATITRNNISVPSWNAIGLANIWPINGALLPPSNPQWDWDLEYPPPVPLNEEFQIRSTNTGAGEQNTSAILVVPDTWSANIPRGRLPIQIRATAAVTLVANAWSAAASLTLEQSLRGGVYVVYDMQTICTNGQFARIIFPRQPLYKGRKLRPGREVLQVVTNTPNQIAPWISGAVGEWGRFHTFELPTVEIMGSTAGAQTAELRISTVFMGEDISLMNQ